MKIRKKKEEEEEEEEEEEGGGGGGGRVYCTFEYPFRENHSMFFLEN